MSEPTRPPLAATLFDLADDPVEVTVLRPSGAPLRVQLRPLTEAQMRALRQSMQWPEPPVTDIRKDANGRLVKDVNRDDPDYRKALDDAEALLVRRTLVNMLCVDIAGATEAERVAALEATLGQYVFSQLLAASQRLNLVGPQEVAAVVRSFRPRGVGEPARGAVLAPDAAPVAEPAAG